MKYYSILLALCITAFSFAQHQKTLIRQTTIQGDFRKFSYAGNTLYGVAYDIGRESFVLKSTNFGNTWTFVTSQPFLPNDNLTAIYFVNELTGWVAGSGGRILKTTDGGNSWINQTDSSFYIGGINDLYFKDVNNGFASGASSLGKTILKTTNGGTTWTGVDGLPTNTLYNMYWKDNNNAWVVGTSVTFHRTTDGGNTWTTSTVTGGTGTLYDIKEAGNNTFYMAGANGRVYKSTDGGVTFSQAGLTGAGGALYALECINESTVIATGSNGVTVKTTNGGTNWTEIPSFTTEVIRTSWKQNNLILLGAYRSSLYSTTDAGVTWNKLTDSFRDFYGVDVAPNGTITIAGDRGEVNYSTNAGLTWNKTSFMTGSLLYTVKRFNEYLYVAGQAGGYFISSDNGNTWSDHSIGTSTTRNYKISFVNETNGYMVTNQGNVFYTTNRGVNWNSQATFSAILYDVKMISPTKGFTTGSGDRIYETNDGVAWGPGTMATPSQQITGVFPLSETIGFICGQNGAVYKSTDGFNTLTLLTDTFALDGILIHDVFAFDEHNVWAVGQNGVILRSTSPTSMAVVDSALFGENLLGITKYNENTIIVVGGKGSVYLIEDMIIPVELSSFSSSVNGNDVFLSWVTNTETNNSGFQIERKDKYADEWKNIGFVTGIGTTSEINYYSFFDNNLPTGSYNYRLKQIDFDGSLQYHLLNETITIGIPEFFVLEQNYPNPFNPVTKIRFSIPTSSERLHSTSLLVYDILGNEVAILLNEMMEAGMYEIDFDASALSSGVYFYRLNVSDNQLRIFSETKKMILLQ